MFGLGFLCVCLYICTISLTLILTGNYIEFALIMWIFIRFGTWTFEHHEINQLNITTSLQSFFCLFFFTIFLLFDYCVAINWTFSGSPAPGQPTTTMIMEGLETLVAPSHHAFLLTESAAAAHFNVLSFDTCLLKSAATTTTSFANNNNNNLFTINNNTSTSPGINCSINCMSASNSSNNTDSNHPSHHTNHIERSSNTEHQSHSIADAQNGDLNTPVTTSSDIPSFFGPNTIEPPHITGKNTQTIFKHRIRITSKWTENHFIQPNNISSESIRANSLIKIDSLIANWNAFGSYYYSIVFAFM